MAERSIAFGLFAKDHASTVFKKVGTAAESSAQAVDKANDKLAKSTLKQMDAAGKARVAELKLKEVRESGKASASQLGKAEEAVASAQRKAEQASKELERATKEMEDAQKSAAGKSTSLRDALSGLHREGGKAETALSKIKSTAAGVFAGLSVTALASKGLDFIKDSVREAVGAEAVQAQLQQAIQNTGKSYESFAPKIEAANKAMMNLGFTDEDTKAALASMTTALGSPEKALAALSTAADLARFKHIGLADAGLITAKILNGQGNKAVKGLGLNLAISSANAAQVAKKQKAATKAHEEYLATLGKSNTVVRKSAGSSLSVAAATRLHQQAVDALNRSATKTPALQDRVVRAQMALRDAQDRTAKSTSKHGASTEQVTKAYKKWKDAQKEAVAAQQSGQKMFEAVANAVQGQADTFAQTGAGGFAAYQATMQDVKQQIGSALLPELLTLSSWFRDKGAPALEAFVAGFTGNAGLNDTMTDAQKTAYNFGQSVKGAFQVAKNAIGGVVSFISEHQSGVAEFAKIVASIWTAFKVFTAVQAIVTGIMSVASALGVLAVAEGAASGGVAVPAIIAGAAAVAAGLAGYAFMSGAFDSKTPGKRQYTTQQDLVGVQGIGLDKRGNPIVNVRGSRVTLDKNTGEVIPTKLATGGIVTQPTYALVGEAGPEAVIPLSRAGSIGGNTTYELHIHGSIMTEDQTLRAIYNGLQRIANRNGVPVMYGH